MPGLLTRRAALTSAIALAACRGEAQTPPPVPGPLQPLKAAVPYPFGAAVMAGQLADARFQQLFSAQFSQLTPEWQMKMEAIIRPDGGFDFSAADAIAGFAGRSGIRLHGHTLVWYSQDGGVAFKRVDGQKDAFANAYRNYILAVVGRYRGQAVGWDVVNEPVAEDGDGYRDCIWRRNLGLDYIALAYRHAREADPSAILLLNDYDLEVKPGKRRTFLALAESLLKAGAPLGGLGTQMHIDVSTPPSAIGASIRDLASLGLPVHVSELDVSLRGGGSDRYDRQAALYQAAAEALASLPAPQRYALTVWGVRDRDSWLRRQPGAAAASEQPLLFDDAGQPKPAAAAIVRAFAA